MLHIKRPTTRAFSTLLPLLLAALAGCGGGSNDSRIPLTAVAPEPDPSTPVAVYRVRAEDIVELPILQARIAFEEAGITALSVTCFEAVADQPKPVPDDMRSLPSPPLTLYRYEVQYKDLAAVERLGFQRDFDATQFQKNPGRCTRRSAI